MTAQRRTLRLVPPAPSSGVRLAPSFERGIGDRREDCQRYSDCLDAWARRKVRNGGGSMARCPSGCASFELRDRRADIDAAALGSGPGQTYHQPWGWGFEADGET